MSENCKQNSVAGMFVRLTIMFGLFYLFLIFLQEFTSTSLAETINLIFWILIGLVIVLPFVLFLSSRRVVPRR